MIESFFFLGTLYASSPNRYLKPYCAVHLIRRRKLHMSAQQLSERKQICLILWAKRKNQLFSTENRTLRSNLNRDTRFSFSRHATLTPSTTHKRKFSIKQSYKQCVRIKSCVKIGFEFYRPLPTTCSYLTRGFKAWIFPLLFFHSFPWQRFFFSFFAASARGATRVKCFEVTSAILFHFAGRLVRNGQTRSEIRNRDTEIACLNTRLVEQF